MHTRALIVALMGLMAAGCTSSIVDAPQASEEQVTRVEPLSWWIGMRTPLQLMVQGHDISSCQVQIEGGRAVSIAEVHRADNPDFVFIDVNISRSARPGTYSLLFTAPDGTQFRRPYELSARAEGSAERGSYSSADLIYLINPDRFANGDPSNDSVPEMTERCDRSWEGGRHGGDIQGMIDHLDYIAELGATAIWPTPLLEDNDETYSYHGYACSDYYHIDPRYGSNELYREFVSEAHSKGLKVLMDVVTNHCGITHWWMQDTPFEDWVHPSGVYTSHKFSVLTDPTASERDRQLLTDGWFVPTMPDMNLDNPYVLRYFQQWAVWWIEYAGIDGFRVDTYPYNERYPMSEWCAAVRREYPSFNIVGECWDLNPEMVAYFQDGAHNRDGFNSNLPSTMDFPLNDAFGRALRPGGDISAIYTARTHDAVYPDPQNMLIFLSNHDTPRIGDVYGGDINKMKIGIALLSTLRGIPQFYYGDELMLMTGRSDRDDGRLRMDFPGGWEGDPVDLFTVEGRSDPRYSAAAELHDYAAKLFNWRKGTPVLHDGQTMHFLSYDDTYAYFRYNDTAKVFIFVNNSAEDRVVPWSEYAEIASDGAVGQDVVTGQTIDFGAGEVIVGPESALVVEL